MKIAEVDIQVRHKKKYIKRIWNMQRIKRIRQRIYDFFHPSVKSLMREFAIVEEPITQEEYEKCIKMIAKLGVADAEQFVDLNTDGFYLMRQYESDLPN